MSTESASNNIFKSRIDGKDYCFCPYPPTSGSLCDKCGSLSYYLKGISITVIPKERQLRVKKSHPDAIIPTKANEFDAGLDLYAVSDYQIFPHYQGQGVVMVDTGIIFEIPVGYYGLICDRSGMGSRGYKVFGGVIDASFRGEVKVLLAKLVTGKDFHLDNEPYQIKKGDRIAQMIIQKVEQFILVEVDELTDTSRGENGFNSSGR